MTTRVEAVAALRKDFEALKKVAMMPVPPHPDFQQAPPQGGGQMDPSQAQQAPPQGAPPQGAPPADPAQAQAMMQQQAPMPPQGAPPTDPNAAAAAGGQPPAEPPAVPGDMAAMMDKVIQTVESQSKQFDERNREQEARIAKLEHELNSERQVREERRKVIDTLLPAV